MKFEIEITVKSLVDYKKLHNILISKGFKIKEKYQLNDIYMIPNDIDINCHSNLEILKKCILIRNINNEIKQLVYKYKKYENNGDILEQGKVRCNIVDIEEAKKFMEIINYKELFRIYNSSIVYYKDKYNLVVQLVKDQGIYIEIEAEKIDGFKTKEDLIKFINNLNLPIEPNKYFIKKAEEALIKLRLK